MSDAHAWIGRVLEVAPRRVVGSDDERRAHELLAEDLRAQGLDVDLIPFRHNRSLYLSMAVHFAIACLGTLLLPIAAPAALALHLFAALAYWGDSTTRIRIIRRLLPQHDTQNLVATRPASAALRRRLVFVSHMDAAYTGWIFHPEMIRRATAPIPIPGLGWLRKSMLLGVVTALALAGVDVAVWLGFASTPLWVVAGLLTIPSLLTVVFNGQVVLNNTIVPGANDNLTGCWAHLELARRLLPDCPDDVEIVFVATGGEEAGTGGAWALAEQRRGSWSPDDTIVLGIDSLTNGTLRYFHEGELLSFPVPPELEAVVQAHAPEVPRFEIPSGATDALPFLVRGYRAMSFGCVDPDIGAPRNYHWPTDDLEHLDLEQLHDSVDVVERVARALLA